MTLREKEHLARETADTIAENPYVKFVARTVMIALVPFVYWITSQTVSTVTTMGMIVQIQQQLQGQIQALTQEQSKLLDVAAIEAQSRSTQDAAFQVAIENLKERATQIDEHLAHTDDRLNSLFNTPRR